MLKKCTLLLLMFITLIGNSDCNFEQYSKLASEKLSGYVYLKTYNIDASKGNQVEYSYVFSSNTNYILTLAQDSDKGEILITVFDNNRKELCSNYDKKNNKYFSGLGYSCSATGIYYVTYTFKNDKSKCAASVLGFKK